MNTPSLLLPVLSAALLLASCGQEADAAPSNGLHGQLTLTGSSTVAPLAAEIGRRFETLHPGVRIDVQTGGSSKGISDAKQGLADIGMASRALKGSEPDEVRAYTIAQDGVGVILHATNAVGTLSDDQVRSIYRGEVSNWSEVGGDDAEITVVNKASGRATLEVFLKHFGLEESEIQADVVIGDNQQGIKTVAGNPHAIGYVSVGAAEYEVEQGTPIRPMAASGIEANTANLAAGLFPISRPLNLISKDEPVGLAKAFIDYCRSSEVHDLVKDMFFVPATTSN